MKCGTGGRFNFRLFHLALSMAALGCAIFGLPCRTSARPQAPSGSITGKVSVAASQGVTSNLSGIMVNLTGPVPGYAPVPTYTDSEGRYEFLHLAPGNYTVAINMDGFKPWSAGVVLSAGQAATQDTVLQLNSVTERVEVQGEATEVATESTTPNATVTDTQLESLPLATGKFTEALSVSPSVIKTQQGRLNFNGQAESQSMLLVDGTESVDPITGSFGIPIPVDAIQSIQVFTTPDSSAYGGFSGAMTRIDTRPPSQSWNYKFVDFIPSFRAKNGHLVGLANITPRIQFGGPSIKNKFSWSEDMTYEYRRDPVRGLSWPYNETTVYGLVSFTQGQWTFSAKHILSANLNIFPSTILDANINALIPQTASVNFHRRGVSLGISDDYQFNSGAVLNTVVRATNFYSDSEGHGYADMTINPEGYGGNYFNDYARNSNQVEVLPILQLPTRNWHGAHQFQMGEDILYRQYAGSSQSRPVQLLDQNGTLDEQINFVGAGQLRATDYEFSEFLEDHWTLTSRLSLNYGVRLTSQHLGRDLGFGPRGGLAYNWPRAKTVIRGGAGLIYGHVPLLAADYADNQTRVRQYFTGPLAGQTITFQNVYVPSGSNGGTPGPDNLANSPRTFVWNVEVETEVSKTIQVRAQFFETHSKDLFLLNPILPATGTIGLLELRNTGSAYYRQAEIAARYRPSEKAEFNLSYSWSRARGDLNTLSDTLIPIETPVIRPNAYGIEPSDIPQRLLAWGYLHLPFWGLVVSPVLDVHSGYAYSNVDVYQNYVGVPNSLRFPLYLSLDGKLYKDFNIHLPFGEHRKTRKIRLGVYAIDFTNRHNPHDVFNNVSSPLFGQFAGFQRRFTGLAIGMGE